MNKKVLVLEHGAMTKENLQALANAGFSLTFIHNIDGIRQIGDVPLRDYFAAAALQAMVAKTPPVLGRSMEDDCGPDFLGYKTAALAAYRYADAMLAEREKGAK